MGQNHPNPPNQANTVKGHPSDHYSPLSGSTSRVESPRYRCPVVSCHQVWYRPTASDTIPHCPIHDLPLVRDSKVH